MSEGALIVHARRSAVRSTVAALVALVAAVGALARAAYARPPLPTSMAILRAPGRVLDVGYADVDGDGREDIVVAHLSNDGDTKDERGAPQRYLSVFRQLPPPERWEAKATATRAVPADTVAFAPGDFDPTKPGAEVALLGARQVELRRKSADGTLLGEDAVVGSFPSFFDYPAVAALPRWDLASDLGGGRLDLLAPLKDGYQVLRQEAGKGLVAGSAIKVQSGERFGPALETKFLNRFLTYVSTLPRVVAVDLDGDGRRDLVVYRKRGLARFKQRPDGTFPEKPDDERPLAIVEESSKKKGKTDGAADKGGGQAFSNVRLALADLNGDGFAELVATRTLGEVGVFETLRTQVVTWSGSATGWNEENPDRIINQKGVTTDPQFVDWDGDGKKDLILSSLRMDYFTNVRRAITKSITITYAIYVQTKKGFPEEPDFTRDVSVDLDALERRNGAQLVSFDADLNGDKLRDMIVRSERGKVKIVPGSLEEGVFSGRTLSFDEDRAAEVDVPPNCDVESRDLYKDGKGEVLVLWNPAQDDPERATVRVLEVRR